MLDRIIFSLILAALVALAHSQVFGWGPCPKYELDASFNDTQYFSGRFYEQKRYWTYFERRHKCPRADYERMPEGHFRVNNSAVHVNSMKRRFSVGEAYCDVNKVGSCHIRNVRGSRYGHYDVIASDPAKYGLFHWCHQLFGGLFNYQFAWIFTREKKVNDTSLQYYLGIYKSKGIDTIKFIDADQSCDD